MTTYFNPRSPCGERPSGQLNNYNVLISIHAPRVGSDRFWIYRHVVHVISIHAPRVGSDYLGGRRMQVNVHISIHAPRVGSDPGSDIYVVRKLVFQSTLPVWGATTLPTLSSGWISISIHAPRVGSDELTSY